MAKSKMVEVDAVVRALRKGAFLMGCVSGTRIVWARHLELTQTIKLVRSLATEKKGRRNGK